MINPQIDVEALAAPSPCSMDIDLLSASLNKGFPATMTGKRKLRDHEDEAPGIPPISARKRYRPNPAEAHKGNINVCSFPFCI